MTISGIGSNSFSAGQMSGMMGRPPTMGMASGKPPAPAEVFSMLDQDGSGGLETTEFTAIAEQIGPLPGQSIEAAELFAQYDTDNDGSLNQDETTSFLDDNRPEGPPPGPPPDGMMGGMNSIFPPMEDLFRDSDENGDGSLDSSEAQRLAEIIATAGGEDIGVEELISTYDADHDGVLSGDETKAALDANRPQGPPPGRMGSWADETASSARSNPGSSRSAYSAGIARYLNNASLGYGQAGEAGARGMSAFLGEYIALNIQV